MNSLKILIKDIKNAPNYNVDTESKDWYVAEIHTAIIVPNGMESGAPSIDLQIKTGNVDSIASMSFTLLEGLYMAAKGVKDRTKI